MSDIQIKYEVLFEGGRKLTYDMTFDPKSLRLNTQQKSEDKKPDWAKLEVEQCSNCPLSIEENEYCPVALNLADLIETFKNEISHTQVGVRVTTEERIYVKKVSVQQALFSIFGLIMATSGCPVMAYLKPMARFHLPFASVEESIIRSVSMHLLRQYFEHQRGEEFDLNLKKLDEIYSEIQKVNIGLNNRISKVIKSGDANQNTVTTFHSISKMLSMSINKNLKNYEYLFQD